VAFVSSLPRCLIFLMPFALSSLEGFAMEEKDSVDFQKRMHSAEELFYSKVSQEKEEGLELLASIARDPGASAAHRLQASQTVFYGSTLAQKKEGLVLLMELVDDPQRDLKDRRVAARTIADRGTPQQKMNIYMRMMEERSLAPSVLESQMASWPETLDLHPTFRGLLGMHAVALSQRLPLTILWEAMRFLAVNRDDQRGAILNVIMEASKRVYAHPLAAWIPVPVAFELIRSLVKEHPRDGWFPVVTKTIDDALKANAKGPFDVYDRVIAMEREVSETLTEVQPRREGAKIAVASWIKSRIPEPRQGTFNAAIDQKGAWDLFTKGYTFIADYSPARQYNYVEGFMAMFLKGCDERHYVEKCVLDTKDRIMTELRTAAMERMCAEIRFAHFTKNTLLQIFEEAERAKGREGLPQGVVRARQHYAHAHKHYIEQQAVEAAELCINS